MEFPTDGTFPDDPLVRAAFQYSWEYVTSAKPLMLARGQAGVQKQAQLGFERLTGLLNSKKIDLKQYKKAKRDHTRAVKEALDNLPQQIDKGIEEDFRKFFLVPACELVVYAENPSPALIAAALVANSCVSLKHYLDIRKNFPAEVSQIVAGASHILTYGENRDNNLLKSSPDVRRLCLSLTISDMDMLSLKYSDAIQQNPSAREELINRVPPERLDHMYLDLKHTWGTDPKLETHIMRIFNNISKMALDTRHLELDDSGNLVFMDGPEVVDKATKVLAPSVAQKNKTAPNFDVF